MQHLPKMAILWIFGFACFGFIVFYVYSNSEQDNQNQGIQETLQATVIANQDYSERTEPKAFYLNKGTFEKSFNQALIKNKNFNASNQKIEFSYLPSEISNEVNAISGVKVKVIVNDKLYQGTVIVENGKDCV